MPALPSNCSFCDSRFQAYLPVFRFTRARNDRTSKSPAWRCRSIVKGLMKLTGRLAQNINTGESDLLA
jgi:hypothetical protein